MFTESTSTFPECSVAVTYNNLAAVLKLQVLFLNVH
jgi:hypothetical protein